jgi:hypothetical protein
MGNDTVKPHYVAKPGPGLLNKGQYVAYYSVYCGYDIYKYSHFLYIHSHLR